MEAEKRFFLKTNEENASYLSPTTTSGGRITSKLLKYIPPVYLGFAFNIEKAVLSYFSREVVELISFLFELRLTWKCRSKKGE